MFFLVPENIFELFPFLQAHSPIPAPCLLPLSVNPTDSELSLQCPSLGHLCVCGLGNCFRKSALMPRSCGLCPPRAEGRNSPFLPFLLLVWQLHSQQLASRQDDWGISPIRGEEWPQDKAALLFLPLVFTGLPFLYTALRNVPRI